MQSGSRGSNSRPSNVYHCFTLNHMHLPQTIFLIVIEIMQLYLCYTSYMIMPLRCLPATHSLCVTCSYFLGSA